MSYNYQDAPRESQQEYFGKVNVSRVGIQEDVLSLRIENKALREAITDLEAQIEKMKCCENCKYNSYWGNELHCNYGLKEALQEDKLVECNKMDKWELAGQKANLERWFGEAKDLLDKVLRVVHSELHPYQMQPYLEVLKQAEQFLKEEGYDLSKL